MAEIVPMINVGDENAGVYINLGMTDAQLIKLTGLDTGDKLTVTASLRSKLQSLTSYLLKATDSRDIVSKPYELTMGTKWDFVSNTADSLDDGGVYHIVQYIRQYGSGTDLSGGPCKRIGLTDNGNIWLSMSVDANTWGAWKKVGDSYETARDNAGMLLTKTVSSNSTEYIRKHTGLPNSGSVGERWTEWFDIGKTVTANFDGILVGALGFECCYYLPPEFPYPQSGHLVLEWLITDQYGNNMYANPPLQVIRGITTQDAVDRRDAPYYQKVYEPLPLTFSGTRTLSFKYRCSGVQNGSMSLVVAVRNIDIRRNYATPVNMSQL